VYCAVGYIAQAVTLNWASSGKVSLFSSLSVVMPPLLDYLFRHPAGPISRPLISRRERLVGAITSPFVSPLIAVLGACILEWGGLDCPHIADLNLLIAPAAFAMAFWRSEVLAERYPDKELPVTGLYLATVSLIALTWAFIQGDLPSSTSMALGRRVEEMISLFVKDKQRVLSMLFTSCIATAWTSLNEQKALAVLTAAEVTLIYSLEPMFAAFYAWVFMGEVATSNLIVGGLFLLVACAWDAARVTAAHWTGIT